jgi:hypothetical protein
MSIKFGARAIKFEGGKARIVVPSKDKLPAVIDTLIAAVRAGRPVQPGCQDRIDRASQGRLIIIGRGRTCQPRLIPDARNLLGAARRIFCLSGATCSAWKLWTSLRC